MAGLTVNVLDGAGVIGGNKILIQQGKTNLLLDFGTNFALWNQYFEEYLKPRSSKGFLDAAELDLLPPIPSLYRPDLKPPGTDPWSAGVPSQFAKLNIDGIILTHAHLDHCGYLSYVKNDIPIVCTTTTAFLLKAIQDTSKSDLEKEVCYCIPREEKNGVLHSTHWKTGIAKQGIFYVPSPLKLSPDASGFWSNPLGSRPLQSRQIQQADSFAGLKFLSFPVDHSIPGCAAFALETEVGWVVYTGDLRVHGLRGKMTMDFAEQASKLKPKVLLCEGTRVTRSDDKDVSETEVRDNAFRIAKRTSGLIIADFGSRNIERLHAFRDIAKECGRELVLMTKDIHLLNAYFLTTGDGPDPSKDKTLRLYQEQKATESTADRTLYETYKQILISSEEISREQARFILCFSFWDLNELIDIHPSPNSVYIYSSSEAYDEEQRADMARLHNWLQHFKVAAHGVPDPSTGKPLAGEAALHASGHASAADIARLIEVINPEIVVPIHTEAPQFFAENFGSSRKVIIPQRLAPFSV